MNRFHGKTVLITGAGSGIGAAAARRFHSEGANVVLSDIARAGMDVVVADMQPERVHLICADVSSYEEVVAMIASAIERFGRLDVLVANAGIALKAKLADMTLEQWRNTLSVDLDGVFYCARAALSHLIASQGSIINTASVSGIGGDAGMAAYNAAKGGVVNFTRSLALELGPLGVRVNAVCPTVTESGMSGQLLADLERLKAFHERIPLRRHALPEEIAGPIAFLASDDASFISGVVLPVDGGLTASSGQP
jgi:meso-butanediol dehydrogenase/(S,S)-butanediol dehydrogenase/diacetyl reductase